MTEERYLTVHEVATRVRVSEETVRRWLRSGRLHGIMPGGTKAGYRVRETELARFLSEKPEANQGWGSRGRVA